MWLASYPRSGNTYLRILLNAAFGSVVTSKYDEDYSAFPEVFGNILGRTAPDRFGIRKTHDIEADCSPAIYIIRDGRASVVSYFHFCQKFEVNRSLESIIRGQTPFGSWSSHYRGWSPKERESTLFLRFEDVVARPDEAIEQLAGFLCTRPIGRFHGDFQTLHQISPDFFRTGSNSRNALEMTEQELALFDELHGDLMRELGYYTSNSF